MTETTATEKHQILAARARRFSGVRVAVLGHPVLDRYLYGVTHRISREAPVLIVREESEACSLGGAANTAANLAGLGAAPWLVGPVGADLEADLLARNCVETGVLADGLIRGAATATTTKTRILAGGLHTTRQQMLRIDRECDRPPPPAAQEALLEAGKRALEGAGAVIISDYGDGALTEVWRAVAQAALDRSLPVVVDSRHSLLQYVGVTAVTPNEPEAEIALGRTLRTPAQAERAALELRDRLELQAALLTRGREGMVIASRGRSPVHIAAVGGEAVDVTGAGDTVSASFSLGLACGASFEEAARLANYAASIVVQKTGTAPITLDELITRLERTSPQ